MSKKGLLIGLVMGAVFAVTPLAGAADISIGGPSDNDNNAIVSGGVHSVGAIQQAYNNNDCVREVFGSFGISSGDIANLSNTVMAGRVTKSGDVFVSGHAKPVARHAITGGRQNMAGSTPVRLHNPDCKLFRRPPSVSFVPDSLPAFVSMVNGQFQFAIIASCGNAVTAVAMIPPSPKPTPPTPAPAPSVPTPVPTPTPAPAAPTQTQTQTQTVNQKQEVTVQTPPATAVTTTPTPTPTTPTEQPAQAPAAAPAAAALPNTGPGDVAGLFIVAGLAGFFGYRRFLLHKIGH